MGEITQFTKKNSQLVVNLAMAYGGREEIVDGVKKVIKDAEEGKISSNEINKDNFSKYLYLSNEPDLIIRTGGDQRTSNFLMWQSWYSEWCFLDKFWPEFEKNDLEQAISNFSHRERRFGK